MLERKERSPEMWKQVAVNQAATAVVAANFPDLKNVEFVMLLLLLCPIFVVHGYFLLCNY